MNKDQRIENEELILEQVSKGDSEAFRTLYLYYYDRLFQFATMILRSEAAAEDVVEDIFFYLWRDRSTLTSIPNFRAYIYQSVRNGCFNALKSGYISKREDLSAIDLQVSISTDSPFQNLTYKELQTAIEQAIASLPERCQLIFKMAKEDEMNHQEIADILEVKRCTVERQLLLAKEKIKSSLKHFLEKD